MSADSIPIVTKPRSRDELKRYIKSQLGEPVIEVNIHDGQMETRIQEAVDLWTRYHHDATEHVFVGHKLTEVDSKRGWIEAQEAIHEVVRILSIDGVSSGDSDDGLLFNLSGQSVSFWGGYTAGGHGHTEPGVGGMPGNGVMMFLVDQQQAYRETILNHEDSIRFNTHTRRIMIDAGRGKLRPGKFVVYEAFASLEGLGEDRMWNDDWLKRYATALVKLQWGTNLTKFVGGTLFGGEIQINGQGILDDARTEITELKEELYQNHVAQPMMWVG